MQVGVVGTGYVGLVSAACFAENGHKVIGMDSDVSRIVRIGKGDIPIYEPGLEQLVKRGIDRGQLRFTNDFAEMIKTAEIVIIAVGTPTDPDTGAADLTNVDKVADTIGDTLDHDCVVINKSTVPVGTCQRVQERIDAGLQRRNIQVECEVASNPEFLKEGSAVEDFLKPDRIIIGCRTSFAQEMLHSLYQPFSRNHQKIIVMDTASAELTKYAANCLLATKISFINQIATVAEQVGANIELVRRGIGSDPRIGYHFIYPGLGYGGSCFPKDVRALIAITKNMGMESDLLESVERVNQRQKDKLFHYINQHYSGKIQGKTFALWGLAFKPNTDDMREAPSLNLINHLLAAGARVCAYDPQAIENCRTEIGENKAIRYVQNAEACVLDTDCDALLVCTEWGEFRSPDWQKLAPHIRDKVVFDGRNLYLDHSLNDFGLSHYAVGIQPRIVGNG